MSFSWILGSPDASDAARRSSFSIFIGKDQRLKTIEVVTKLPPGDTYLSDGAVSVTLISPSYYQLRKVDVGDQYLLDMTYTVTSAPAAVRNRVWIVGNDNDMGINNNPSFLQFEISDTARVYVLYDAAAPGRPTWLTSQFAPTGQTVTTTNPTTGTFDVYMAVIPKGTVRLGGNDESTTGANCNYVALVRRPVAGDLGSPEQIATTEMALPRTGHRIMPLDTGKILIFGGIDTASTLVLPAELYDTPTQTFTATGSMIQGRINPAVVKLNDGRVMAIGGDLGGVASVGSGGGSATGITALATCEIYNPGTATWSAATDMGWRRRLPEAIKLADGRIFVSGGVNDTNGFGIPSTEIYDPVANSWTAGPDMLGMGPYNTGTGSFSPGMRYGHRMSLLADGRVLIAGGLWHGPDLIDYAMTACDIYDPISNTMTVAAPMAAPRGRFGFVDIGGDKFLAIGGLSYQAPSPPMTSATYLSTADVEVYDAVTNTWLLAAPLPRGIYDFAVSSPDPNRALIFDGFDVGGAGDGNILLFDKYLNSWTSVGTLVTSRSFPYANGAAMAVDVGGKDFFLCGGVHYDETTGQTNLLYTGERFKY